MIEITTEDGAITAELANARSSESVDDSVVRECFRDIMRIVKLRSTYGMFEYTSIEKSEISDVLENTLLSLGYSVQCDKIPDSFSYLWTIGW